MNTICPKCGITGERINDRAMFEMKPASSGYPYGQAEPIPCHIIDGVRCLHNQITRLQLLVDAVLPVFEKRALRHVPAPNDATLEGLLKNDMDEFAAIWDKAETAVAEYQTAQAACAAAEPAKADNPCP